MEELRENIEPMKERLQKLQKSKEEVKETQILLRKRKKASQMKLATTTSRLHLINQTISKLQQK